jgi:hypothetical protein
MELCLMTNAHHCVVQVGVHGAAIHSSTHISAEIRWSPDFGSTYEGDDMTISLCCREYASRFSAGKYRASQGTLCEVALKTLPESVPGQI